jgi:hypothetical protein
MENESGSGNESRLVRCIPIHKCRLIRLEVVHLFNYRLICCLHGTCLTAALLIEVAGGRLWRIDTCAKSRGSFAVRLQGARAW